VGGVLLLEHFHAVLFAQFRELFKCIGLESFVACASELFAGHYFHNLILIFILGYWFMSSDVVFAECGC